MFGIRPVGLSDRDMVAGLLEKNWGSSLIVTRGRVHDGSALPGFIAEMDGEVAGLVTYSITGCECEIVSLDSFREGKGIGGGLIDAVTDAARSRNCKRVWLVTTNDNTNAIRFYQKRGFSMVALYPNAITKAREIKPQIPLSGFDGIPVEHELEFEKRLKHISVC